LNYLIIDIGNTNIDFVNFNKLTNKYSSKFTVDTLDILKGHLGIVNKKIKKNFYKSALCSSVVPNAFNKLKKILKTKNLHLNEIKDRNLNLPIKIKLNKPKQVGSDRVVNAIAAFKIYNGIFKGINNNGALILEHNNHIDYFTHGSLVWIIWLSTLAIQILILLILIS